VKTIVADLEKSGKVTRGYLGVSAEEITPDLGRALDLPGGAGQKGALVASVEPNSPAAAAGVQPGDVITKVDNIDIGDPRDLAVNVANIAPGASAQITLLRNGQTKTISATLASLPAEGAAAGAQAPTNTSDTIGVELSPLTADLRQQLGLSAAQTGVAITNVVSGSAAEQAGLQQGDVIVSVGSTPVNNVDEAAQAIRDQRARNKDVALRILRQGQISFVVVTSDQG